jgi:hypothetical protein
VAVLLCLLLVGMLGLTAASLALLARRSSGAALLTARAEALAESDPVPGPIPVPAIIGSTAVMTGARLDAGWSADWTVTRLGGALLLIRGTAQLTGPGGAPLARAAVAHLARCCDSLPPTPLPGGWLGAP